MDTDIINNVSEICKSILHYFGLCNIDMHFLNISYILLGHLLFYLFGRYLVFIFIYKYNEVKRKRSIKVLGVLNIISFSSWVFAEVTHNEAQIQEIIYIYSIVYLSKMTYHIFSYLNVKIFGKSDEVNDEIKGFFVKRRIKKEYFELINESSEQRVILGEKYIYYPVDDKLLEKVTTKLASKTTKITDIIIFISILMIAISLIIPLLSDVNAYLKDSYALPIFGLFFIYVLGPVYPNLYGAFLVIKNEHVELGDFIRIKEKNIKGRVIEVDIFYIKLKDHTLSTIVTIPSSYFMTYMVENLNKFQNSYGRKEILEYVLGYELYSYDKGERIKVIFKNILDDLEADNKAIFKGDEHNVWIVPDNDGVKLVMWYFVADIEKEEKIKLQVEDYILVYCTNHNVDLRTPKLLDIVSANNINNRIIKRKRG